MRNPPRKQTNHFYQDSVPLVHPAKWMCEDVIVASRVTAGKNVSFFFFFLTMLSVSPWLA